MKGIVWNVRGLNKPGKTKCLNEVIRKYKPDFVGFSETKKLSLMAFLVKLLVICLMCGTGYLLGPLLVESW